MDIGSERFYTVVRRVQNEFTEPQWVHRGRAGLTIVNRRSSVTSLAPMAVEQTLLAMDTMRTLFEEYGLLLVFGAVFLEQMGPPLPSGPQLIIAGALANEGRLSAWPVAGVAWGAGMLGKAALYVVGGHYGRQAMHTLCRLAVAPNSNIGKTDGHFERWGAPLLVIVEFIPGVRTLAPSLAGAEKIRPTPFLLYSALGAALWTALYVGIGLVFRKQIDRVLAFVEQTGKVAARDVVARLTQ